MTPQRTFRRFQAALVGLAASGACLAALYVGATSLERIPHVSDEAAYLFQARTFASGSVVLPPPPLPALFAQDNVLLDETRWCSKYPPGWPAALAVGVLLGAPWLVNPLLLALAVLAVWRIGRELFDHATGTIAAVALAASPFAVLMAAGMMAHVALLCAAMWCLAMLVAAADREPGGRLALAGLLGGSALLVRPFSAAMLLLPGVVWALWRRRTPAAAARAAGWMALGFAPCVAALLLYQALAFGHPLQSGYELYDPTESFRGYHGTYLTLAQLAARNVPWYLARVNHALWGWPWPDLLPFAVLLWPARGRGRDAMLAACAAGLLAGHQFWYFRDVVYSGPRFAFEALGPLSVLLARALLFSGAALGRALESLTAGPAPHARRALAVVLAAGLALFPAIRLSRQATGLADWYHGQSLAPLSQADAPPPGTRALVFVTAPAFAYAAWFGRNELVPNRSGRMYVRDLPELRQRAADAYPEREVWQLVVDLEPLDPGHPLDRNEYPDRFRARRTGWKRIDRPAP